MYKTLHLWTRRAPGSSIWVLTVLAVGCGGSPSPVAPGGQLRGEYYIQGAVLDTGSRSLPDATVTIVDGPLAGTSTRTNDGGRFDLRGSSPGTATLRIGRDGFQTWTGTATWLRVGSGQAGTFSVFRLVALESPIGLEPGRYTLTVTVDLANARDWKDRPDASCAGFPAALASRSYRAEIKAPQLDDYRVVTAEDPTLRSPYLFGFHISGDYVGFWMDGYAGDGILEDFPGFRYLEIGGGSTSTREPAVRDGSSISVPIQGGLSYCHLKSALGPDNYCFQMPADQILEHHVCFFDRATLVFTKR
jgi:hypothetical protein